MLDQSRVRVRVRVRHAAHQVQKLSARRFVTDLTLYQVEAVLTIGEQLPCVILTARVGSISRVRTRSRVRIGLASPRIRSSTEQLAATQTL